MLSVCQDNMLSVYSRRAGAGTPVVQTELHLYGSSRLGMALQHTAVDTLVPLNTLFGWATKSSFTRGEKLFELSNHLGNVLATVSDRRQQVSAGGVAVDGYTADVQSAQDYYPEGRLFPASCTDIIQHLRETDRHEQKKKALN